VGLDTLIGVLEATGNALCLYLPDTAPSGGRIGWVALPSFMVFFSGGYSEATFDRQDFTNLIGRPFGMGMRLGHAMLPCIGREHAALSVTDGMPKDGAVMNRAYTSSIPGVCSQIHVTGVGCSTR
jgi:hypothetical protein